MIIVRKNLFIVIYTCLSLLAIQIFWLFGSCYVRSLEKVKNNLQQ